MRKYFYTFNHITTPQLVLVLKRHLETKNTAIPWHICWLNNLDHPIIGVLPKVAWALYPAYNMQQNNGNKNPLQTSHAAANDNVLIEIVKWSRLYSQAQDCQAQDCQSIIVDSQRYLSTLNKWVNTLINYSKNAYSKVHPPATQTQQTPNVYQHGLMGFIGYDISAKQLSPNSNIKLAKQPCAFLGHYDITLTPCLDAHHKQYGWQLNAQIDTNRSILAEIDSYLTQLDKTLCQHAIKHCGNKLKPFSLKPISLQELTLYQPSFDPLPHAPSLKLTNVWDFSQYKAAFDKTLQYLYQGDSYQINLTQCWQAQTPASSEKFSLINYLPKLCASTQAPFAGYLQLKDFELLSCSPELFLTFSNNVQGKQHICAKPIKGTRPRSVNKQEDEALKRELINSEKDRSENVMIVDLLRNDLGKYATTGSVHVPKLFAIESFSNVHHMVSTVEATLKNNTHPLTVLFGSLPAGSITGTPKKRAVELICELECGARGAYCGTMGYMNFDGSGQWNVLIRSLQMNKDNKVRLWAGGAITVGSTSGAEYQECLDKVGNLLDMLKANDN